MLQPTVIISTIDFSKQFVDDAGDMLTKDDVSLLPEEWRNVFEDLKTEVEIYIKRWGMPPIGLHIELENEEEFEITLLRVVPSRNEIFISFRC